jgi:hypothetical protein
MSVSGKALSSLGPRGPAGRRLLQAKRAMPGTVLIVDADLAFTEPTQQALEAQGLTVHVRDDAPIDLIRKLRPHVMMVNVELPRGASGLRDLRPHPPGPRAEGHADPADRGRHDDRGAEETRRVPGSRRRLREEADDARRRRRTPRPAARERRHRRAAEARGGRGARAHRRSRARGRLRSGRSRRGAPVADVRTRGAGHVRTAARSIAEHRAARAGRSPAAPRRTAPAEARRRGDVARRAVEADAPRRRAEERPRADRAADAGEGDARGAPRVPASARALLRGEGSRVPRPVGHGAAAGRGARAAHGVPRPRAADEGSAPRGDHPGSREPPASAARDRDGVQDLPRRDHADLQGQGTRRSRSSTRGCRSSSRRARGSPKSSPRRRTRTAITSDGFRSSRTRSAR